MAPSKTSAVTRRSTRVAVKKSVASASVKESALTTSAARGRQKATKVVSIAKVGLASRTGKASKKGTEVVSRDHCSRSFDVRSPVGDDYQGQQLASGSSVETSLLEESSSSEAADVDNSSQHRKRKGASRAGELTDQCHRSTVGNKHKVRRSRSLCASPRLQRKDRYDLARKSSALSGRGTSPCATGSKSTASFWRSDRDLGHGCGPSASRGRTINDRAPIVVIPPLVGENKEIGIRSLAHADVLKVGVVEKPLLYVTVEESTQENLTTTVRYTVVAASRTVRPATEQHSMPLVTSVIRGTLLVVVLDLRTSLFGHLIGINCHLLNEVGASTALSRCRDSMVQAISTYFYKDSRLWLTTIDGMKTSSFSD